MSYLELLEAEAGPATQFECYNHFTVLVSIEHDYKDGLNGLPSILLIGVLNFAASGT